MFVVFVVVFAVAASSVFVPEPLAHVVPEGWRRSVRTASVRVLSVHVALSRQFSHVSSLLHEQIANVDHPLFARYDLVNVSALTSPSPTTVSAVMRWARKAALHCQMLSGHTDWMTCSASAKTLEKALSARFFDFHSEFGFLSRSASYSLPEELRGHVDLVAGVKRLPRLDMKRKKATPHRQGGGIVTPQRSRALWGVNVTGSNKSKQEVAQFLGQYMSFSDLNLFWNKFSLPSVSVTIVGPNNPSNPGAEASLDIQTITGINQGTPTQFTYTDGLHSGQEPFLVWLLAIAGGSTDPNPPMVHSVSYGDDEDSVDVRFV